VVVFQATFSCATFGAIDLMRAASTRVAGRAARRCASQHLRAGDAHEMTSTAPRPAARNKLSPFHGSKGEPPIRCLSSPPLCARKRDGARHVLEHLVHPEDLR